MWCAGEDRQGLRVSVVICPAHEVGCTVVWQKWTDSCWAEEQKVPQAGPIEMQQALEEQVFDARINSPACIIGASSGVHCNCGRRLDGSAACAQARMHRDDKCTLLQANNYSCM